MPLIYKQVNSSNPITAQLGDIWEYKYVSNSLGTENSDTTFHILILEILDKQGGFCKMMIMEDGHVITGKLTETANVQYRKLA